MSTAKQEQALVLFRRRRILLVLIFLVILLVLFWWGGFVGRAAFHYGGHLAKHQRLLHADVWYQHAEDWGEDSQEFWFSRARLARKLARDQDFSRFLTKATEKGLSPYKKNIEIMLSQAQRGDLSPLRSSLADLLVRGEDADEICFAYAQGCVIKYHLDDAMQIIGLWEADYPNDPRPHLIRGRLYEHGINFEESKSEFQDALEKNPKYSAAAYNMGRILETEQKPLEAIPYYRIVADTLMNKVPGLVAIARCQRLTQQYEAAKQTLEEAAGSSNDQDIEAFRLLGDPSDGAAANLTTERGYLAATMDDHREAVRFLEESLELAPNDWRARYQLAVSLRQIGKQKAAQEHFAKVDKTKNALASCDRLFDILSKEPGNIEARVQIGEIFLNHLSENQGLVWLNSVLDLDPDNEKAHRLLAGYFRENEDENQMYIKLAEAHEAFLPDDQASKDQ